MATGGIQTEKHFEVLAKLTESKCIISCAVPYFVLVSCGSSRSAHTKLWGVGGRWTVIFFSVWMSKTVTKSQARDLCSVSSWNGVYFLSRLQRPAIAQTRSTVLWPFYNQSTGHVQIKKIRHTAHTIHFIWFFKQYPSFHNMRLWRSIVRLQTY